MKNRYLKILFVCSTPVIVFLMTSRDSEKLQKISREYKTYTLLYNKTASLLSWTVLDCTAPPKGHRNVFDSFYTSKASPQISLHGNKLYKLYVKEFVSYVNPAIKEQPVGQIIVKETWNTVEVQSDSLQSNHSAVLNLNNQKWHVPTTVSELFIMFKEKEDSLNDKGWKYGVVS